MIRLDRFLTEQNIASRSEAKNLCKKGVVKINGSVCRDSATKLDSDNDTVTVSGEVVHIKANRCYMLYKPVGYISAVTDETAPTVISLLQESDNVDFFPIGRLDKDSEGLLLLTNDGALCHELTSPRKHVPKTYEVWITGHLTEEAIQILQNGTDIGDDKLCLPAEIAVKEELEKYTLTEEQKVKLPKEMPDTIPASRVWITITEGRYHQVKRMFHANRHEVFSLKRMSIGGVVLDKNLAPGEYRLLTEAEERLLRS